jgi:predicted aconitase with swiveling domain
MFKRKRKNMSKIFKGRPILQGNAESSAEVSHVGFSPTASYIDIVFKNSTSPIIQDHDNSDLYGRDISGKFLCLPQSIGSSAGACMMMAAAKVNALPKAMLFSNHVDSLSACGLLMAKNFLGTPILAIDMLGDEFLKEVKTGDKLKISEDGTVEVLT